VHLLHECAWRSQALFCTLSACEQYRACLYLTSGVLCILHCENITNANVQQRKGDYKKKLAAAAAAAAGQCTIADAVAGVASAPSLQAHLPGGTVTGVNFKQAGKMSS
jgi:hypothetical protein